MTSPKFVESQSVSHVLLTCYISLFFAVFRLFIPLS